MKLRSRSATIDLLAEVSRSPESIHCLIIAICACGIAAFFSGIRAPSSGSVMAWKSRLWLERPATTATPPLPPFSVLA